jgi:hypothetical protein
MPCFYHPLSVWAFDARFRYTYRRLFFIKIQAEAGI